MSFPLIPEYGGHFEIHQKEQWLQYLDDNGYVVIKNVASKDECSMAISLLWDFLESMSGGPEVQVHRDDSSTWTNKAWFPSAKNGLANGYGIGQSKFMWYTRLLPKIETAFKIIWGEDKQMLTSFTGGSIFRSFKSHPEWKTSGGWWHVDQNAWNPMGKGKVCFQGLLTYLDASEFTGGLCVIPGSHKYHDELCARNDGARQLRDETSDYIGIPEEDPILLTNDHKLICCNAGDFILWDSRTVHCNSPALSQRDEDALTLLPFVDCEVLTRVVAFVCMTPKEWADETILEKRRQAFIHNESTSHWPHRFFSAGGRSGAAWIPRNDPTRISSRQRQLIGFPSSVSWGEYWHRWWGNMRSTNQE